MNNQLILLLALRAIRRNKNLDLPVSSIRSINETIEGGIRRGTLNTVIGGTNSVSKVNALHVVNSLAESGVKSYDIYDQMKNLNLLTSEVLTALVDLSTKELNSMKESTTKVKSNIRNTFSKIHDVDDGEMLVMKSTKVVDEENEDIEFDMDDMRMIQNDIIRFINIIDDEHTQGSNHLVKKKIMWGLFSKAILLSTERDSDLCDVFLEILEYLTGAPTNVYFSDKILANFDEYESNLKLFDTMETWFDYDEDDGEFVIWGNYREHVSIFFKHFLESFNQRYSGNPYVNKFVKWVQQKLKD